MWGKESAPIVVHDHPGWGGQLVGWPHPVLWGWAPSPAVAFHPSARPPGREGFPCVETMGALVSPPLPSPPRALQDGGPPAFPKPPPCASSPPRVLIFLPTG